MIRHTYTAVDDKRVAIYTKCPMCGKDNDKIVVNWQDYENWNRGKFIQDAFPKMSAGDRERLMTGYCDSCWDKLGDDEE